MVNGGQALLTSRATAQRGRHSTTIYYSPFTIYQPLHSARQVVVPADALEEVEVGEHLARAQNDRGERVVGDGDRKPRLDGESLVEVFEERAAARQDDAALDDVRRKLRRRAFECDAHGVDDCGDGVGQRLSDFLVGDGYGLGYAFDEVPAPHVHRERLVEGEGRAELNLDGLGGLLAGGKGGLVLDGLRDCLVHLVFRGARPPPGEYSRK